MATTQKGIYYNDDYDVAADVLEDERLMAESIDSTIDDLEAELVDETTFNTAIQGLQNNINAKYTKPNEGIPKTDLTNDVQTSLGKADTAIQEHQSLTDYVKNTDYATSQKGGVVKIGRGSNILPDGTIYANVYNYSGYNSADNSFFISKGTLENVIPGKNLETANNKTTTLDENSTDTQYPAAKTVYDKYKDIIKTNEEQAEEIEDLKKNRLTNTPEIATEIDINDSADSKVVSMDLDGNSEQETTEGYQLFNIYETHQAGYSNTANGITITYLEDGGIKISGTSTSNYTFNLKLNFALPAGVYSISGCKSWYHGENISGWFGNDNWTHSSIEFTEDVQLNVIFYISSGKTINETYYPIIYSGSTEKPYEKYTGGEASPNPSYPQEIISCGDNVNEFNISTVQAGYVMGNAINTNPSALVYEEGYSEFIKVQPNTTYTFKMFESTWSGFNAYNWMGIGEYTSNDLNTFVVRTTMTTGTQNYITFTTSTTTNYVIVSARGLLTATKAKLEKGTVATPYSPYNMGSITEKIVNKNLFDKDNYQYGYILSGTAQINSNNYGTYIKCKPNTTYTVSKIATARFRLATVEKLPTAGNPVNWNNYISGSTSDTILTITSTSNDKYLIVNYHDGNSQYNINDIINSLQIEQGSTATSYEPHQEQNIIIPTQQPRRAIGEVRDDFVKVDGNWYERHNFNERIYDGVTNTLYYNYLSNQLHCGYANLSTIIKKPASNDINIPTLSNRFISYSINNMLANARIGVGVRTDGLVFFSFGTDSELTSTSAINEYLQDNNISLIYPLAEPTLLPCTEEQTTALENLQKARTHKNVTHITSEDTVKPYIDLEYVQDNRTLYDDLRNAIVALGGVV